MMSHRQQILVNVFFVMFILSVLAAEGNFFENVFRFRNSLRTTQHTIIYSNVDHYSDEDSMYGITWMYFPDGDGVPQVANLTEPPNSNSRGRSQPVKEKVRFELYTR